MPACLHTSRCLSAADIGPGTAASRRTASGPGTLYSPGEACHLGSADSPFTCTGQKGALNRKGLFQRVFLFNGIYRRQYSESLAIIR